MQKTSSAVPIHGLNLSAYLFFKGVVPELRAEQGRVVFLFPNQETTFTIMEEYNGNQMVPVLDFVAKLRRLRAQMLSLRGSSNN